MSAPPDRRERWSSSTARSRAAPAAPLHAGRTRAVFGAGNADAELMFVGEAPGAEEDRQGMPFVGRAGQLLDQLLEGIGLKREDVFIANILKSRPPANRDPQPDEIEACWPYLERQIQLVEPRVIATLGNFATKQITGSRVGITRVRGARSATSSPAGPVRVPAPASRGRPAHAVAGRDAARGLRQAPGADRRAALEPEQPGPEPAMAGDRATIRRASSTCSLERHTPRARRRPRHSGRESPPGCGPGTWSWSAVISERQDDPDPRRLPGAGRRPSRSSRRPSRSAAAIAAGSRSRTSTSTGSTTSPARIRRCSTTT